MTYDPYNPLHRCELAFKLRGMLRTAGFVEMDGPDHAEKVFSYQCIGGTEILVYSSIVQSMVRGDGEDAIRVCAVYRRKDGKVRGLFKDTRINRTGQVDKIVERTKERMRNAYVAIRDHWKDGKLCPKCKAPLFLSKGGKWTCAETCWLPTNGIPK